MTEITQILKVLSIGGVVLLPTDTVWGLIADAQNEAGVKKIYQIKHRDNKKPLQILLPSDEQILLYAELDEFSFKCIRALSGKSITYVLKAKDDCNLNPMLILEGKIGIRITTHTLLAKLISRLGHPLAATSANISNKPSPCGGEIEAIDQEIKNAVDCIINEGANSVGVHSTVVELSSGRLNILRTGCVTEEEVQKLVFGGA